ncbi:hypothetical protein SGFS_037870 [Streptomyces graminofaciens]|uniref:Uncharacterized protein n=1 Tax=Streptomyces graminofaciens TaxID=68212 RepID=A0ABM8HKM8_9ACTN|nr:hypothetical protein SGFS_037870 [Streptomyces graminofaciens]
MAGRSRSAAPSRRSASVIHARAAGLAAATVALLRAPFLVVVAAAVIVTAGVRALTG